MAVHTEFISARILITANAKATLYLSNIGNAIAEHLKKDWENLKPQDCPIQCRHSRCRWISTSHDRFGTTFYIVTELDRSVTTVLLPEDDV